MEQFKQFLKVAIIRLSTFLYMLKIAMQVEIYAAGCSKRGALCYATPGKSNNDMYATLYCK